MSLLEIEDLKILFASGGTFIPAVEGLDMRIGEFESVALVGESGCGKTVTGYSMMGLLNSPPAFIRAKKFRYQGGGENVDILEAGETELRRLRGRGISMVFQEPSNALNPVITAGRQLSEVFLMQGLKPRQAAEAAVELMRSAGISAPEHRYGQYPHELSGGMKQRLLIAMATACCPKLLIADEPTTALDLTIQAQILHLIRELQQKNRMAMLLITHDLGVVAHSASRVYVMYCGKIVEHGPVRDILDKPLHPYTQGLIWAASFITGKKEPFRQIPLSVPHPSAKPRGCYFHPRCEKAGDICRKEAPPLVRTAAGRELRCWLYSGGPGNP
jgi:oligopeptide/dipeptide ABC transporter ATP-binding protein